MNLKPAVDHLPGRVPGRDHVVKPSTHQLERLLRYSYAQGSRSILALPMANVELSRRVKEVVGHPPLSETSDLHRREVHEALLDADSFDDPPGMRQAAIPKAEQSRPQLRVVGSD